MKFICVQLVELLLVGSVVSDRMRLGECPPDVPFERDLDLDRFMGPWYVVRMSADKGRCDKMEIKRDGEDLEMILHYRSTTGQTVYDHTNKEVGELKKIDPNQPALLKLKYSLVPYWENFTVVTTDYDKYAAVLTCSALGKLSHRQNRLILSRKRSLDKETTERLQKLFNYFGGDIGPSRSENYKRCFKDLDADTRKGNYWRYGTNYFVKYYDRSDSSSSGNE